MKFAMEVLSLFAFLLGSPLYLPRVVDSASARNAAPNPQPTPSSTSLPPSK